MKAPDVHALLLTCRTPARALRKFGEAVAQGSIAGTATVIYKRNGQVHEGQNAKLQRYWRRIEGAAEQASVWTTATADFPAAEGAEAVRLTSIAFNGSVVEAFVHSHIRVRPPLRAYPHTIPPPVPVPPDRSS